MSRQEEMREGIKQFFLDNFYQDEWHQPLWDIDFAVDVFIKEVLKGVVMLVNREQKYSEQTGVSIEPIKYKILESLI